MMELYVRYLRWWVRFITRNTYHIHQNPPTAEEKKAKAEEKRIMERAKDYK